MPLTNMVSRVYDEVLHHIDLRVPTLHKIVPKTNEFASLKKKLKY